MPHFILDVILTQTRCPTRIPARNSHPSTRGNISSFIIHAAPIFQTNAVPLATACGTNQMSSRLLSAVQSNALLVLPEKGEGKEIIQEGDIVQAIVIGEF